MFCSSINVLLATALFCSSISADEILCFANSTVSRCGERCEARCNAPPGLPSFCNELQCEDFGCRCNEGFAKDPISNHCVLREECPVNECAVGEAKFACGKTCEGTCESPREPEICSRISCFLPECRCDLYGGFVRNSQGNCIRKEEC